MVYFRKDASSLERRLSGLLDRICSNSGICLSPPDYEQIVRRDRWTADEFTREVLKAEGFDPSDTEWYRPVRDLFVECFEGEVAEAEKPVS